ncbi:MAG TPA: lipoprotein LpqH [Gordonia sp. (in: high G+C Gram-positive bacteria)]|uniref:lipoprotein LpqH n=1 Tax=unclassified Gordonia (in: high G+C Gram-positive bacteria) TaxID=2657482 RepID=UPI000FB872A8|nr:MULTISPECIES: lipoprotein LpqH [unclassified Gordonia (in: high G+C Gram-positive bacteria)]RUP36771.1 MAG: hypothetical protein EKK60_14095 [Gordonia sp. (in: high G+C Gram-positive bacteria)]HNP56964.1 lipoprotein LpqH [Gordonia sp. (in: high G+C Gram-positive bacteria)]HRC50408.1 lipoprotein LpqH [Gordonia sp. (in: high G+C Gram-positive bacteria)]
MRKTITTTVVAGISALGLIGALGACSSDNGSKTGGEATVTVDGKPLDLGSRTVACTTHDGKVLIAVGDNGGNAGVGATVTEGDKPEAQAVGLGNANGQALGWTKGVPGGEATATKDGKSYTITGKVSGVDMANPTAVSTKSFEMKVTCP